MSIAVTLFNAAATLSDLPANEVPVALGPVIHRSEGSWTPMGIEASAFLSREMDAQPLSYLDYEGMGAELRRAKMFDALVFASEVAADKES